jgi:FkbM family methyltransferase
MTVPLLEYDFRGDMLYFASTPTAPALIKEIFSDNYKVFEKGLKFGAGDVILDAGANEGMFSIMMAKAFPDARIIALEPVPRTFFHLVGNLGRNGIRNVEAYNTGLGAPGKSTATMNVSRVFSGGSSSKCTFNEAEQFQVPVSLITLDAAFDLYKFSKINLLKMDIEGMEYEVLYNSEFIPKVVAMALEVHINQKLEFESRRVDGLINWLANRTRLIHVEVCRMAE